MVDAGATTHGHPAHLAPLPGGSWAIWRLVALRGSGFPAELILRLASSMGPAADRVSCLRSEVEAAEAEARRALSQAMDRVGDGDDPAARQRRREVAKALRAVGDGKLPKAVEDPDCITALAKLQSAHASLEAALAKLEETFAAEIHRLSEAIDRVAADERFREAVTWQNRAAAENALDGVLREPASAGSRTSQRRRREEVVASYLQRYCVKNDTIGFFGPLGFGAFVDEGPAVEVRPGRELLEWREVFFENWCIDALARRLSADAALKPYLAPRLGSSVYLEDGRLRQPFAAPQALSPLEQRLLATCDGRRTARSLAQELVSEDALGLSGEADVYALLEDLCRRRIVIWTLEVPLELHPDRTLEEQLLRVEPQEPRERALRALGELRESRRKVALAAGNARALGEALRGLEETFTRLTGLAPFHNAGRTYAARTLVYEDCRRAVEVRFGPQLMARLGPPLTLVLDGARWLAGEITRRLEEKLRAIYRELRQEQGQAAVASHRFHSRALASLFLQRQRDSCFEAAEREYQERWSWALDLAREPRTGPLRFATEMLRERCAAAFARPGPSWTLARYFSPDVLIAAPGEEALRRGEYEIVLGEIHTSNTLLWSCFTAQHPDPDRLAAELQNDAGARWTLMPQMVKRSCPQRFNIGVLPPQVYWYEFADDPPGRGGAGTLRAGDMVVEETAGRLWARTRDGCLEFAAIDLFSPQLAQECNSILGALLPPGPHRPRLTVGDLVIAREGWEVTADELEFRGIKASAERVQAIRRWAFSVGLPRFTFYRTPGERKPRYLDLESPVFIDLFVRAVAAAAGPVTMTEMLPQLDQLWLSDAQANLYTCELRLAALAHGDDN
jgi:lantibiotic biosynthesis dehydratase-like protein